MVINKVVYFVVFSNESFLIEYSAMLHRLVLGLLLAPAGAVRLQYSRRVVASGIASGLTLQALKAPVRADGDEIVAVHAWVCVQVVLQIVQSPVRFSLLRSLSRLGLPLSERMRCSSITALGRAGEWALALRFLNALLGV